MLVVGCGGLATQLFDDLVELRLPDINFWSEVAVRYPFIGELYPILKSDAEVRDYFSRVSNKFLICVGGKTEVRRQLRLRFEQLGGVATSYVSPFSRISPYSTSLGEGTLVLNQVNIEPQVRLGACCLVNKTANIGHGVTMGDFCEVGPGVIITGEVAFGSDCYVGTGAIIHPKLKIGHHVTIAAGAVVTKSVPDHSLVAGAAADIKYQNRDRTS